MDADGLCWGFDYTLNKLPDSLKNLMFEFYEGSDWQYVSCKLDIALSGLVELEKMYRSKI